ncbi:MAG: ribosome small subunit-dependent GTPase A [Treponema sp.]|jgi:ribosome biogenesis GTPase|nr:ribosome small subunit-dependent GTPase A [Treponema sp.]
MKNTNHPADAEKTEILKGLVIRSSRNIITARIDSAELECRIKGKVLKDAENQYNPVAPGDVVVVERKNNSNCALVLSVEKRRNVFSRFNQKGMSAPGEASRASQLLAANADLVLCLCTPVSPPFRPRFIDRVLLQAEAAGIEALVICNKIDIEYNDIDVNERLEDFKRIGYKILYVSAKTGEGMDSLRGIIAGKTSVLIGQSGVGKSSLINALSPGQNIKEGCLNEKYDRGVHTTTLSFMVELAQGNGTSGSAASGTRIIDTPGVRLFIPDGIQANEVISHLREFAPLAGKCSYGLSCSHKTEPGCKIMEAVTAGVIHEDRYESFLRITEDLKGIQKND